MQRKNIDEAPSQPHTQKRTAWSHCLAVTHLYISFVKKMSRKEKVPGSIVTGLLQSATLDSVQFWNLKSLTKQ